MIEPLITDFTQKGFRYQQVERQGNFAIFTQEHESGTKRFELVRIRVEKETLWPNGRISPPREIYPTARLWGIDGWTFFTLTEAQDALQAKVE